MKIITTAAMLTAGAAVAQPASFTDLGVLTGDGAFTVKVGPNEIQWFRFEIGQGASGSNYLDLTTSSSTTNIDTEIGLYANDGSLAGNDDDNGVGLASTLSFGAGSGLLLGDVFNLGGDGLANGENGPLAAGVYFIAVGEFDVTFGPDFGAESVGTDVGGTIEVSWFTNIPTPGAAALAGVAGIAAIRRRR